ncbi:uncharacterized protein PG986_011760 [Apiospora aurea]|uniref:Rhodopsin domain-containing protein n=1 Tax=Apiospora aurea TaxID=335848 RepID=A0ABR1PY17_9PEZI
MDAFSIEAFTLLGIGLTVIALRTYIRVHAIGPKGLQSDDYLMWLVAFAFSMETMIAYTVSHYWQGLANSCMTDEYRRMLSPSDPEYRLRVNGSKTHIVGWCSYILALWATKGSMCAFYLHLTDGLESLAGRVRIGFYILAATYIAVTSNILFACGLPFKKNWQIYPDPGNSCQTTVSINNYIVTMVLNILTDIYLMAIPVPMLLHARLRTVKKLGLCLLFSGGIFVGTAAILRCVLALEPSPPAPPDLCLQDPKDNADTSTSWAVRESFVAIWVTNMPVLWPSILKATQFVRSTLLLGYYANRTEGGGGGGSSQRMLYELRTKKGRRVRRSMHHITTSGFSEFTGGTTATTLSPGSQDIPGSGGGEEQKRPLYQREIRVHIAECMRVNEEEAAPARPRVSEREHYAQPLGQV